MNALDFLSTHLPVLVGSLVAYQLLKLLFKLGAGLLIDRFVSQEMKRTMFNTVCKTQTIRIGKWLVIGGSEDK